MDAHRLDPRVNAYRPDLADQRLEGRVAAERFAEGALKRVGMPSTPLRHGPSAESLLDSELLFGERIRVFADTADGWSWIQNEADAYVGFVATNALAPLEPTATHRVAALRTFVYSGPDMKLPAVAWLSLGAEIAVIGETETRGTAYLVLAGGKRAVVASHLQSLGAPPERDFVAVAERFLNVPYLWGGRTSLGLDCSALVQLSLMAAGKAAPRDTDMQRDQLGTAVEGGHLAPLKRGDLVFWPGHVAILTGPDRIVHASGHHMTVVSEPLADAVARIGAIKGPPTVVKRLD